ncbi:hypothetical protein M3795_16815 [Ralstonia pickettii]|uniref:hypothetical protein n=1 Tax=Ralstonia pickettii TaxID=329 RepID=UPI00203B0CD1|nr:hypothetical protein [Ralstonia pickettii]MCM3582147.1 hypothetical protein [Ralstonia pickettii]
MDEPTLEQVIEGYRRLPLSIEERAAGIARHLSRGTAAVAVERIDGTVAHFLQQTMLENPMFHLSGGMGNPHRFEVSRFEIDMAPPGAP